MKNKVQRFGKFLSGMVMPNIGALIAFGFLAALFIDTGWIPNKGFNSMVGPMLTYLIPVLIASTGGRMIGGDRGRVVGAIAVIGAIMSNTEITMLMAAMVMGPLAGCCIKKFDEAMDDDFNTADAISAIFELVKFANSNTKEARSKEFLQCLKDKIVTLSDICGLIVEKKQEILDKDIEAMIEERQAARKARNFQRADEIRNELLEKGIVLEDTREGVKWKRA